MCPRRLRTGSLQCLAIVESRSALFVFAPNRQPALLWATNWLAIAAKIDST
ncbi:uncharacterized protein TrAtP1_007718 [Trichoderma atroviride]|uniref:uncharacterized protein n=1 Tax=Hypocrea atroviridis TaxID=63577 RepID=UPI00332CD98E|nr:hypothetical protein TrAtP1_007718 [Trichoderma atroviride]